MTDEERIEFKIQMVEMNLKKGNSPYVTEGLVLLLKLLKIKPRTIETLQMGDLIEFSNGVCKWYKNAIDEYEVMRLQEFYKGVELKIIPREYIEMWEDDK